MNRQPPCGAVLTDAYNRWNDVRQRSSVYGQQHRCFGYGEGVKSPNQCSIAALGELELNGIVYQLSQLSNSLIDTTLTIRIDLLVDFISYSLGNLLRSLHRRM